jgi:hypothetical protein
MKKKLTLRMGRTDNHYYKVLSERVRYDDGDSSGVAELSMSSRIQLLVSTMQPLLLFYHHRTNTTTIIYYATARYDDGDTSCVVESGMLDVY